MDFQNPFWQKFCFETGLELKGHSTIEANTCEPVVQCGLPAVLCGLYSPFLPPGNPRTHAADAHKLWIAHTQDKKISEDFRPHCFITSHQKLKVI